MNIKKVFLKSQDKGRRNEGERKRIMGEERKEMGRGNSEEI